MQTSPSLPPHTAPRTVRAWRALTLAGLVLGYAGYYLCRSDLSVAAPLIIADLGAQGVDEKAIGTFASVGVLVYAAGKLFSGVTCDFLGGRRPFLAAMLASAACTWWFGASSAFGVLLAAWCANRLVQSTGWSALVKISSNWYSFEHYGRVMSVLSLSWLFGDAAGRFFLGRLIAAGLGWRTLFAVAGAILVAIWGVCLFAVKESPAEVGGEPVHSNPDNLYGAEGDVERAHDLHELVLPFLRSTSFWAAMAMCFCLTLIRETFNLWLPRWLTHATGISAGEAAQYSALFPLFGGFSVVACGFISDRLLRGRRGPVISFPLLGLVGVLYVMGLHDRGLTVGQAMLCVGLAGACMIGPYSFLGGAISLDLGGRHGSATAAGLIDTAGYLAGAMAGRGIGAIAETYGWDRAFTVLSAVAVLAAVSAFFYWYRHEVVDHRLHESGE
ncbi:MAG: MFS transporter [Proteobacteria bacterium]|nr:MFS transporter [Pseudomonadota bacterium]